MLMESVGAIISLSSNWIGGVQRFGSQAPTRASFTFFTELAAEKELILIHGRFDGSQMNLAQSSLLLQNFCAAYSRDELFQWVQRFHDRPIEFDFNEFMKILQKQNE